MNDDELLKRIGRIAKERDAGLDEEAAAAPRDEVAQARIVAELARELGPRKRRAPVWAFVSAGVVTVAAAAAVFLVRGAGEEMPLYVASAAALQTTRGPAPVADDHGCELAATEKGEAVLVLTPASPVHGEVHARAWIVSGGAPSAWPGTMEVSEQGAVRLAAEARALRGAREVVVVLARRETRAALDAEGADVRRLSCRVRTP